MCLRAASNAALASSGVLAGILLYSSRCLALLLHPRLTRRVIPCLCRLCRSKIAFMSDPAIIPKALIVSFSLEVFVLARCASLQALPPAQRSVRFLMVSMCQS